MRFLIVFWVFIGVCATLGGCREKQPSVTDIVAEWEQTWPKTQCGLSGEEYVKVAEWAFGDGGAHVSPSEWPDRWKLLHPDEFRIYGTDDREETFGRVYHLYLAGDR